MARYEDTSKHTSKHHRLTFDPFARPADFLLFIPTHAPGLKAVFTYYTSTVKLSAEGDVSVSDEALSGFGTTINFLKTSLFGAIIQLGQSPTSQAGASGDIVTPTDEASSHGVTRPESDTATSSFEQQMSNDAVVVEDDPYIPVKPPRRKGEEGLQLKLTDFVPDVGYFVAGGLSGITSRTATAPLDRLKVYLIAQTGNAQEAVQAAKSGAAVQATKHGMQTLWTACHELWAAGGIRSLFAGGWPFPTRRVE